MPVSDLHRRYEAIIQTFEQLTEMVINTMRLEIRCRIMCNLGASLRTVRRDTRQAKADLEQGEFRLESESLEPDPDIIDLNTTLSESEDLATSTLCDDDRE